MLVDRMRRSVGPSPASAAVEGDHWVLTYRDLDLESARVASALQSAGVRPGHIVPMLMGRSPGFVVAMLALLRCGAAYAPIDLSSPPPRRAAMMSVLDGPVAIGDACVDAADSPGRTLLCIDELLRAPMPGTPLPWPSMPADSPLYAMFTSGSTGLPKAVLVPQRAVQRLVCGANYADFRPGARWAQMSSLAFDASTLELWAPLLNGGCCVVQQKAQPSLDELADFLLDRRITDAWLTSALFNTIVDERCHALGGLRQLLTGGERVSLAHARACLAAWPRLRLINGYGPTENTTFSLCHTITPADLVDAADQVPIGRPIHGTAARVASPAGDALPNGEVGELWVAGKGLALGYLGDAALTAQRFPQRDGQRWYRTGDIVRRRADGVHEFLGRADRQEKIAGHRVELDAVELALAACPGVGDVAVLVAGEQADTRHLVGFYSPAGAAAIDEATVLQHLDQQLPSYAMPRRLVALQRLPINLNGKVDRQALATRPVAAWASPAPRPAALNEAERTLAAVWSRCLGTAQPRPESDFMQSGGTSLLALRMAADVSRAFGRHVGPLDVLRNPRLADLARFAAAAPARGTEPCAAPDAEGVELAPSAAAVVRAGALDDSGSAYLVHVALHFAQGVSPDALCSAFEALAQRHPMLRTAVQLDGEQLHARLLDQLPAEWFALATDPLTLPSPPAWPDALTAHVQRPLDIARCGPMRVDAWRGRGGAVLCVWTVHHFAIDEAAIDQALADLDTLLHGRKPGPAYGSAFAFAALERAARDDEGIRRQAAQVAQALAGHSLPLPAPPRAGAELPLPLPADLCTALDRACVAWQCTPFTPLLVACALAQQQLFGPAWRFVLTPFSRRDAPQLLEPVGCLVDLRLVEAGARPGEAPADTLCRVHAEVLAAQQPRFRPLEQLALVVEPHAIGASAGLTQFALTWRHQPERTRTLGGAHVDVLRVPQAGARFGLTLHVYTHGGTLGARIEAAQEAVASGVAARFGEAFVRQLQQLPRIDAATLSAGAAAPVDVLPRVDPALRRAVHAAWTRWLGAEPSGDDAHFLRCGGSSLLAMRLAATLRREHGLVLDVGALLAQPTFGAICLLAARAAPVDDSLVTRVGPPSFERALLLLPGMMVGAVGMYVLAKALHDRLGPDCAVLIIDTDALLRQVPDGQGFDALEARLQQLVLDIGAARVAGVLGYSAGGVLGIGLAQRMGPDWAARVPLWLLDTYAPRYTDRGLPTRAQRALVTMLRHPLHMARLLAQRNRVAAVPRQAAQADTLATRWHRFLTELAQVRLQTASVRAVLIHSRVAARSAGVWRHAASNGFNPRRFGSLQIVPVDVDHYDLRSSAAPMVADIVARGQAALARDTDAGAPVEERSAALGTPA